MKYVLLGLFFLLLFLLVRWGANRSQQPKSASKPDSKSPEKPKEDEKGKKSSPRKAGWGWAVVALLLLIGIGVEWWKYDFHHVRGVSSSFGCQSSLDFTLKFDRSQCLAVTKAEGDGVSTLSFIFEPQAGSRYENEGEMHIARKGGVCTGVVRATHETSALDWEYQLVPTPCERIDDFIILATAEKAPDPKWNGNRIKVTLSRKE